MISLLGKIFGRESRRLQSVSMQGPPIIVRHRAPQDVDVEDLLGRPAINLDTPELQRFLAGKTILVTGAGGSIGSEICRQIMRFCPASLILIEQAENNLFEIDRELREKWIGTAIIPYVADICDETRIRNIFTAHSPQVVLHCAAHKHVPMMENNPGEAVKNNIFGTKVIADIAGETGVDAFVMVSTDKAVNPTSVMGAAKRFAEQYIQSLNRWRLEPDGASTSASSTTAPSSSDESSAQSDGQETGESRVHTSRFINAANSQTSSTTEQPVGTVYCPPTKTLTRYVTVRFGNVLGSSGSVVPIFKKQIAAGGPVTVTHPDMRRFFMTIPEASQLVLQAGAMGNGGEIFVLDMGEPIRILDLAHELIRRSGLKVGDDIEIEYTGIRPGEKLFEELAGSDEETCPTAHPKIRVWQLPPAEPRQVEEALQLLKTVIDSPRETTIRALAKCVTDYQPDIREVADEDEKDVTQYWLPTDAQTKAA